MKAILPLSLLLLCLAGNVHGQDRIITTKSDTIDCRITHIGSQSITYIYKTDKNSAAAQISLSEVDSYELGPETQQKYNRSSSQYAYSKAGRTPLRKAYETNYQIFAGGGYSHLTFKQLGTTADEIAFEEDLASGNHFTLGLDIMFDYNFGVSFTYTRAATSASIPVPVQDEQGNWYEVNSTDNYTFSSYIASLIYRFEDSETVNGDLRIGFGGTGIMDDFILGGQGGEYYGGAFSLYAGFNLQYKLSPHIGLKAAVQFTSVIPTEMTLEFGTLKQVIDFEDAENGPNFSRVDLTGGLVFYLN